MKNSRKKKWVKRRNEKFLHSTSSKKEKKYTGRKKIHGTKI